MSQADAGYEEAKALREKLSDAERVLEVWRTILDRVASIDCRCHAYTDGIKCLRCAAVAGIAYKPKERKINEN